MVLSPAWALTLGLSLSGHLGFKPAEWTLLEGTGSGVFANLYPFPSIARGAPAKPQSSLLCWGCLRPRDQGRWTSLLFACPFNQSWFGDSDCESGSTMETALHCQPALRSFSLLQGPIKPTTCSGNCYLYWMSLWGKNSRADLRIKV